MSIKIDAKLDKYGEYIKQRPDISASLDAAMRAVWQHHCLVERLYTAHSPGETLVKIVNEDSGLTIAEVELRLLVEECTYYGQTHHCYLEALQLVYMGQYEIIREESLQSRIARDNKTALFIALADKFVVRVMKGRIDDDL